MAPQSVFRFLGRDGYSISTITLSELLKKESRAVIPLQLRFNEQPPKGFLIGLTSCTVKEFFRFRDVPTDMFNMFDIRRFNLESKPAGTYIEILFFRESNETVRVTMKCNGIRSYGLSIQLESMTDYLVVKCDDKLLNSGMIQILNTLSLLTEIPEDNSDSHLCNVCYDHERNTVQDPCGHFNYCNSCSLSRNTKICYVCQQPSQQRVTLNFKAKSCMICFSKEDVQKCGEPNYMFVPCGCVIACEEGAKYVQFLACPWCFTPATKAIKVFF